MDSELGLPAAGLHGAGLHDSTHPPQSRQGTGYAALREVLADVVENSALADAIRQGRDSELVNRNARGPIAPGGLASVPEQAVQQQGFQISAPIEYGEHYHAVCRDAVDESPWVVNKLAILMHADRPQLGYETTALRGGRQRIRPPLSVAT